MGIDLGFLKEKVFQVDGVQVTVGVVIVIVLLVLVWRNARR